MPFNMNPQQMAMMRQRAGNAMQRFNNRPNMQPGMPGPGIGTPVMSNQPAPMPTRTMAKGGSVSGASRGDGCVRKGHTKGRMV